MHIENKRQLQVLYECLAKHVEPARYIRLRSMHVTSKPVTPAN